MSTVSVTTLKKGDRVRFQGKEYTLTRPVKIDPKFKNVFTLYLSGLEIVSTLPCTIEKVR